MYLVKFIHSKKLFKTLPQSFYIAQSQKVMASGTSSAQVRVSVGDLFFPPPPHFCSHYITWGKIIRERQRKGAKAVRSSVKFKRRRQNYPGREQVGKKFEKKIPQCRKLSHSAEKILFHIFIHWAKLYTIFIHWTELYPIFIPWTELYPILKHLAELYPILKHWAELSPILIHWAELYPMLIH